MINRVIWLLVLCLLLSACSAGKGLLSSIGLASSNKSAAVKNISLESSIDSNQDTPVAVDLVFVKDKAVTPVLVALNGPQWFSDKSSLLKRYEKSIEIINLEVVPLTLIQSVELPKDKKKAESILLFANYRDLKGQFVADISQFKHVKIRLLFDSYELVEVSK